MILDRNNEQDLLEVTSEPYCRGESKSQFTSDLILGAENITDVDRIAVFFPKFFKPVFFEDLRRTDCFEASGGEARNI